jgi:hypothetical protein
VGSIVAATVLLPASTRLIDEIDREAAAQEDRLEAFAAVRRGFPTARRLVGAMQHHNRQRLGVLGDLIEGVQMNAMERLPFGGRDVVVVDPRSAQHGPADGEAAMRLDDQRRCAAGGAFRLGCGAAHRRRKGKRDGERGHPCHVRAPSALVNGLAALFMVTRRRASESRCST